MNRKFILKFWRYKVRILRNFNYFRQTEHPRIGWGLQLRHGNFAKGFDKSDYCFTIQPLAVSKNVIKLKISYLFKQVQIRKEAANLIWGHQS
ncbi:hypothetical protein Hanom_Chr16g01474841 [Helianthus anomalus]